MDIVIKHAKRRDMASDNLMRYNTMEKIVIVSATAMGIVIIPDVEA